MLFEGKHSFNEQEFKISKGQNLSFMKHIHRSFEFYSQLGGTTEVVIDEKQYVLKAGQAVLIFPFQYHSYKTVENGEYVICFFSPNLVPDFYNEKNRRIPIDNLFEFIWTQSEDDNLFLRRSIAYNICGCFEKGREYIEKKFFSQDQVMSVLLYANENYKQKCLLRDAISRAGYDYAYLSKLFKKSIGITYNQYVNLLRIQEGKELLKSTNKTISQIAEECGFSSLRDFDRKFLDFTGTTPTVYRKQKRNLDFQ